MRRVLYSILLAVVVAASAYAAKGHNAGITAHFKFRDIGPAAAGGRVTAVTGIPGNPKIYYVGTAGGGVWKSTDGGDTWKALLRHAGSASIGAVALAPSNPNLVWVGTGEANVRNDTLTGAGVYFSPDAGKSWQFMGLKKAGQISAIVIDPKDPNTVFVAVQGDPWGPNEERGVFRTTDGGKTWKKVLYVDDKTGASDLIMDPGNPRVLFAGMWTVRRYPWTFVNGSKTGGVWRSTDGGDTWQPLTKGLPDGNTGRISLAAARTNPDHVYALIPTRDGMLWSTTDLGEHWSKISNNHALAVRAWYFAGMAVAPDDENKVYFSSLFLMESDDGGKTAHPIDRGVHVDHHAVWVDPEDPERIIQGNDGGVYLSVNGGKRWRFLDTLPIEQAYTVSVDSGAPFHACVGLQDNSAWCGPTSSLSQHGVTGKHWFTTVGGDGEYAVIAPSNPHIIYSDLEDGYTTRYNTRTHQSRMIRPTTSYGLQNSSKTLAESKYRFNWTSPIAVSPTDANTVYIGANVLFKSTDGGLHWQVISPDLTRDDESKQQVPGGPIFHDVSSAENYDTLLSLRLAPSAPDKVIWAGTDDGLVQVTRDGGEHWHNVTPGGAPDWARVYQIDVSPFDAGTAYVVFDAHMLDDDRAYAYKTDNYGRSWSRITDGLPEHTPVLVVREDPHRKGLLVAGTMTGLYYSLNGGDDWHEFKGDLPTTPVFDVEFTPRRHALAIATHGRGLFVLDNLRPLEEWNADIADAALHLFSTAPGTVFNHWSEDEGQQWTYAADNAPEGVVFDYYLKSAVSGDGDKKRKHDHGPVKIVITDTAGHKINTLHGDGKQGFNEVVWNMDYAGPTPIDFIKGHGEESQGGGPRVAPGRYRATLTVGKHKIVRAVTVRPDPNLEFNPAAYRAQLRLALAFRDQMSAVNAMLNRMTAWQTQLDDIEGDLNEKPEKTRAKNRKTVLTAAKQLGDRIKALKNQLWNPDMQHNVGEDFLHYLPRFHGVLTWNGSFIGGYGQPPGEPLKRKVRELTARLHGYLRQFKRLQKGAVPAFNKQAYAIGAGTLAVGEPVSYTVTSLPPKD